MVPPRRGRLSTRYYHPAGRYQPGSYRRGLCRPTVCPRHVHSVVFSDYRCADLQHLEWRRIPREAARYRRQRLLRWRRRLLIPPFGHLLPSSIHNPPQPTPSRGLLPGGPLLFFLAEWRSDLFSFSPGGTVLAEGAIRRGWFFARSPGGAEGTGGLGTARERRTGLPLARQ